MRNKSKSIYTIILIIIAVTGLVLGGYLMYKYVSDFFIKKEAEEAVEEFEKIITIAYEEEQENELAEEEENHEAPTQNTSTSNSTRSVRYKSFNVIGTIEIPKIRIKYPIVSDNTVAAMESAIVMLYGPGLNEIGNTVVAGHNYRGGSFFGSNKKLTEGDLIYITDLKGQKIEYVIYRKYETSDMDFSYATRNTNGAREISLSTCTNNPATRLIIWAKES